MCVSRLQARILPSPALKYKNHSNDQFVTIDRIHNGGWQLGSGGGNCLAGGPLAVLLTRYDVDVANAWWGAPGGPAPGRVAAVGGELRAPSPLAARPAGCDQEAGAPRRVGARRQPGVRR